MTPAARAGRFDEAPPEHPFAGVTRRSVTTSQMTIASYAFEPGASFPLHSHAQEQWTLVERGSVQMTIGGEAKPMEAGDWSLVDPGVQHGITAGDDGARILAIVSPPRASSGEYELAEQER
jgi:quercetin dioxygenase-like cupin family protein